MPALVPDPVDGQGNGKDTEPKKDINILTCTVTSLFTRLHCLRLQVVSRMAFMGSADTRQAGSSSMQGIVK